MVTQHKTMGDNSPPTDREIEETIKAHAAEIAQAEDEGVPGNTRVSLLVNKDENGEISARVSSSHRNATPLPGLQENEVLLWYITPARDWEDASTREWWLSGNPIKEDGLDYFEFRREGPADPIAGH